MPDSKNISKWRKEKSAYGFTRLLYYNGRMAAGAWWQESRLDRISPAYYQWALSGQISGEMEGYESLNEVIDSYTDKNKPYLDGGCGDGKLLVGLYANGCLAEGIEGQKAIVDKVKNLFPDLLIRSGDVLKIDRPDSYYGTYISLGVVEHRRQGPEPFLQEAYRVLDAQGVLLISVPHINMLRRSKMILDIYSYNPLPEKDFFQYVFSKGEFTHILNNAGFQVVDVRSMGMAYALTAEDLPFLSKYYRRNGLFTKMVRWAGQTFKRRNGLGNMMLFVCRKT